MKTMTALLLLAWSFTGYAATAAIEGKWQTSEGATLIKISQTTAGQWQGIIVDSKVKKALPGQHILSSVTKVQEGYKGEIYAIKAGKHFDAQIIPVNDTLQIIAKAGLFSKEVIWTRVRQSHLQ